MAFDRELVVLLTKPSMFGKILVRVWTKNILYQFIEGQTHFGKICSSFKPLRDLQTCTKKLPNMEGFVSKTTNSLSEVMMS